MATSMARRQNEKLRKAAAGNNLSLVMFGDGDVINSAVINTFNILFFTVREYSMLIFYSKFGKIITFSFSKYCSVIGGSIFLFY